MSFKKESFEDGTGMGISKSGKRLMKQFGLGGDSETDTQSVKSSDEVSSVVTSAKSTHSDIDEELDLEGLEGLGGGEDGQATIFVKKMNRFLKKQAKAFVRNFIDYGPPYARGPFDPALINECARPAINLYEVHKLLNARADPNQPDPEDLYYTPTHWIGR